MGRIFQESLSFNSKAAVNLDITVKQIIDAMNVVGFQDQGREEVIELIQDKFQELALGNVDFIPPELIESVDSIMLVVELLGKIAT